MRLSVIAIRAVLAVIPCGVAMTQRARRGTDPRSLYTSHAYSDQRRTRSPAS